MPYYLIINFWIWIYQLKYLTSGQHNFIRKTLVGVYVPSKRLHSLQLLCTRYLLACISDVGAMEGHNRSGAPGLALEADIFRLSCNK